MKIILTTLNVRPFYPLALYLLQAAATQFGRLAPGDSIDIVDDDLPLEQESLRADNNISYFSKILSFNPDVIAVSLYVWNVRACTAALEVIKRLRPEVTIIAGGPEVGRGSDAESFMRRHLFVDYVVVGEAEESFVGLLAKLKGHSGPLPSGVLSRDGGTQSADASICKDLASLPLGHSPLWEKRSPHPSFYLLETYRGCSNACAYCTWSNAKTRTFPLERVEAELEICCRRGIRQVFLIDPFLGASPRHVAQLLPLFKRFKEKLNFSAFVRTESLTSDLVRSILDANIKPMNAGVQACSERGAQTIRRRVQLDKIEAGLQLLSDAGAPARSIDLIYGIPGDTLADLQAMVNRLSTFPVQEVNLHRLMLLPGTGLRERAAEYSVAYHPNPPYSVLATETMTFEDLVAAKKLHLGADWCQRFFRSSYTTISSLLKVPVARTWLLVGNALAASPAIGIDFDPFDWVRKISSVRHDLFYAARQTLTALIEELPLARAAREYLVELMRFESYRIIAAQQASLHGGNEYHFSSASVVLPREGAAMTFQEAFHWDVSVERPASDDILASRVDIPFDAEITIDYKGNVQYNFKQSARADRGAVKEVEGRKWDLGES